MSISLARELRSMRQVAELLGIATGYHLIKLAGNLIDADEGVIEQRVGQLLARRVLRHLELQIEVNGAERVAGLGRYAVASTHASHLDWAVLLGYFPAPLRFIAKQELSRVPVIGNYLRLRGLLIDRKRGVDSRRAIMNAVEDGQPWPILIFPEGTRSHDGSLGRFRTGGLRILLEAGLPIIPVRIEGTFAALPRGARLVQTGRRLHMTIGDPVRPQDHPSVEAALAELERRMRPQQTAAGSIAAGRCSQGDSENGRS